MTDDRASQVRREVLEPVPGLAVVVLVPADADDVLDTALLDPTVDPYAHTLWPAGLAAAAVLAGRARQLTPAGGVHAGAHVLDIGAGCGIVALTAAKLGLRASALDHDVSALRRITDAAAIQGAAVETLHFDIAGPLPLPAGDVAVFSDVLYDPALAGATALRVIEALGAGMHVIVADPARAGRAVFSAMLTERGYAVAFMNAEVRLPSENAAVTVGILELFR